MATPSVPCVDVNLIVYNSELTIGATMESVLAQTWPAVSVTVMDNGSDDRTTLAGQTQACRSSGARGGEERRKGIVVPKVS